MAKPKGPKGPKKPRPRPIYRALRSLALDALWLAWLYTAGCGGEVVDHVATCTVLGGLVGERLVVEMECPLEPTFLVDFGVACAANEPTEEEALACLGAVYELAECPDTLPAECLLFSPAIQVTAR